MISISIAAAAAKKRVNRPRMSAMPPPNSMINAAQTQSSAGSKPKSANPRTKAESPRVTMPHPYTTTPPTHALTADGVLHYRTSRRDDDVIEGLESCILQPRLAVHVLGH